MLGLLLGRHAIEKPLISSCADRSKLCAPSRVLYKSMRRAGPQPPCPTCRPSCQPWYVGLTVHAPVCPSTYTMAQCANAVSCIYNIHDN